MRKEKKIVLLVLNIIMIGMVCIGCNQEKGNNEIIAVSLEPTAEVLMQINHPFIRIDDNLAQFSVIECKYQSDEVKYLYVHYVNKQFEEHHSNYWRAIDIYNDNHSSVKELDVDVEGNHIFCSNYVEGPPFYYYFSRINNVNSEIVYSLYEKEDVKWEWDENNEQFRYGLDNYLINNIKNFLDVKDNKIFYQDTSERIYSFEMTTREIEIVEDYIAIDYATLPDYTLDYTDKYIFSYDKIKHSLIIEEHVISEGKFVIQSLVGELPIHERGELIGVKALNHNIYTIVKMNTGVVYVEAYNVIENISCLVHITTYEYKASLADGNNFFAVFYDKNINRIEAIKYNDLADDEAEVIYLDKPNEVYRYVEDESGGDSVFRDNVYKDINYLVYKGTILFGYNVEDGIVTQIFKTESLEDIPN